MFRQFLFSSSGVLVLIGMLGIPSRVQAQHGRGGVHPAVRPMPSRGFNPALRRDFMPGFGMMPGMQRSFVFTPGQGLTPVLTPSFGLTPNFGFTPSFGFTPNFNQRFFDPRFNRLNFDRFESRFGFPSPFGFPTGFQGGFVPGFGFVPGAGTLPLFMSTLGFAF